MENEQDIQGQHEAQNEMDKWFLANYGIPFKFAAEMAKWDNPTGEHWKHVLDYLASDGEDDPPKVIQKEPERHLDTKI
jgi:hypothetical protein